MPHINTDAIGKQLIRSADKKNLFQDYGEYVFYYSRFSSCLLQCFIEPIHMLLISSFLCLLQCFIEPIHMLLLVIALL